MRNRAAVTFASLQLPQGVHHRFVTVAEAERMFERGECVRHRIPGRKAIGRVRPVYRLKPKVEPSLSDETPAAITVSDVLANLGLQGSPEVREAARAKIAVYSSIH